MAESIYPVPVDWADNALVTAAVYDERYRLSRGMSPESLGGVDYNGAGHNAPGDLGPVNERFATMEATTIVQAATTPIRAEYAALGMDTNAIQNQYILNIGGIMLVLSLVSGISTIIAMTTPTTACGAPNSRTAVSIVGDSTFASPTTLTSATSSNATLAQA